MNHTLSKVGISGFVPKDLLTWFTICSYDITISVLYVGITVIYLYRYGWQAWRGGPMFWADNEVGLSYLLERLEEMNAKFPGSTYYVPSTLLRRCVTLGVTLEEYYTRGLHLSRSKL